MADRKYEIVKRLGQGGMGSVYLGRGPALDRLVALEVMRDVWPDVHRQFAV